MFTKQNTRVRTCSCVLPTQAVLSLRSVPLFLFSPVNMMNVNPQLHNFWTITKENRSKKATCKYCSATVLGGKRKRLYVHSVKCAGIDQQDALALESLASSDYAGQWKRSSKFAMGQKLILQQTQHGQQSAQRLSQTPLPPSGTSMASSQQLRSPSSAGLIRGWMDRCSEHEKL